MYKRQILIILSSLATVNVTASIQSLVDVYVEPMLTSNSHDFGPLLSFLTRVGLICLIGVLANYGFTLIMATVSQAVSYTHLDDPLWEEEANRRKEYILAHGGDISDL